MKLQKIKFWKFVILLLGSMTLGAPMFSMGVQNNSSSNNHEIFDQKYAGLISSITNSTYYLEELQKSNDTAAENKSKALDFAPSYFQDQVKKNELVQFTKGFVAKTISEINNTFTDQKENYFFKKRLTNNFQKVFTINDIGAHPRFEDWSARVQKFWTGANLYDGYQKKEFFVDVDKNNWSRENNVLSKIIYFDNGDSKTWKAVKIEFEKDSKSNDIRARIVGAKFLTKKILSNNLWWPVGQSKPVSLADNQIGFGLNEMFFEINLSGSLKPQQYFFTSIDYDDKTIFNDKEGSIKNLIWKIQDMSIYRNSETKYNQWEVRFNITGFKAEGSLIELRKLNDLKELDLNLILGGNKYYPWPDGDSYDYKTSGYLGTYYLPKLELIVLQTMWRYYVLEDNTKANYDWNWVGWTPVTAGLFLSANQVAHHTKWVLEDVGNNKVKVKSKAYNNYLMGALGGVHWGKFYTTHTEDDSNAQSTFTYHGK